VRTTVAALSASANSLPTERSVRGGSVNPPLTASTGRVVVGGLGFEPRASRSRTLWTSGPAVSDRLPRGPREYGIAQVGVLW